MPSTNSASEMTAPATPAMQANRAADAAGTARGPGQRDRDDGQPGGWQPLGEGELGADRGPVPGKCGGDLSSGGGELGVGAATDSPAIQDTVKAIPVAPVTVSRRRRGTSWMAGRSIFRAPGAL